MIKKTAAQKIFFLFLLAGGLLFFRLVLAQDLGLEVVENNFSGALGESGTDPRNIIANVINIALGFLGIIAVGIVLYAGFLWMSSNGEEDKVSRAKQILRAGAIGLLIILSAWAIVTFVISKISGSINGGEDGDGGRNYCLDGSTIPCGCGGVATCSGGRWGLCIGSNNEDCTNPPTSCDGSSLLSGCQASDQICADGYFCDTNCSCQPKESLGKSCDGDTSNQTCEADNNRCGEYLTCDANTCLCVGSPVITAVSPAGGFCAADVNRPCVNDADCGPNGTCDQITPNGTDNNFITIFGKNFGEYSEENSQVLFSGYQGDLAALNPKDINEACVDSWRDDQIIITVPAGVQTGPIKVVNADNQTDSTSDDYGPSLPDFVSNAIARPGLCNIDPVEGTLSKEVNYQGINLYSGEAYFGNYENNVSGLYSNFIDVEGLSGTAAVPNIKAGQSGSFVERNIAGIKQKSNYLRFVKEREEADGPYIMSFSPSEGAPGQYVTIKGAGFGGAKGSSRVYFSNGSNKIEASYSFPAICANSVWTDKQIIIKVPDSLPDDNYYLEVSFGNRLISSQNIRPNVFTVDSLLSLSPSLCKMDPVKGPIGTPVTFWGEYFGSSKSSILARFNLDKNSSGVVEKQDKADKTVAEVPLSAVTGPVVLVKDSLFSNELNFLVAECSSDSECSDQICCPQNTYKKGRCVKDLSECFIDIPTSVFEWRFSTQYATSMDPDIASCLGFAKNFGSCYQGAMCPNSPGSCSSPATSYTKVVGSCNISCNDVPGCTAATCTYNADLDKCVLKTTNVVSDCEPGELIAPLKDSDPEDDKNVPRIMYWPGKINQHWNLSIGAWESDIDEKSGAELNKLAYCKKFYPTTIKVEEYKREFSSTWHSAKSRNYNSGTNMSYRCILDDSINSIDLSGVTKTCNQAGQWEIKVNTSCPEGWTMGPNKTCTQDGVTCNSCPANLSCEKINQFNSCVSPKLCQDKQAKCIDNTVNDKDDCTITVEPGCDCCCRIGFDAQDCCSYKAKDGSTVQLQCGGTCGSDLTANPSTNTYGSCSGCAAAGETQAERDAACNCTGTSGKFCSVTSNAPQGICTDCAGLKTQEECGAHSDTCCFDSRGTATTSDDICRGIGDSQVVSTDKNSPDYGYCGYFNCSQVNPLICAGIPTKIGKYKKLADCTEACPKENADVCNNFNDNKEQCLSEPGCCYDGQAEKQKNNSSDHTQINTCISGNKISEGENQGYCAYYDCYSQTEGSPYECNPIAKISGKYKDISACSASCGNPPSGAGLNCSDKENSALNQCNFNLCTALGSFCLQENGLESQQSNYPSCGACCCQPAGEGVADSCKTPSTPDLFCQPGASTACSGNNRGLCCGCSEDSQCGSPTTIGCGLDSCCKARPKVIETLPVANASNVCRNSAIKIDFDQKMDANSFNGNFFLFEERNYGEGTCPEGTFISEADIIGIDQTAKNSSILQQIWGRVGTWISKLLGGEKVLATPPDSKKLYCAVDSQMRFSEEDGKTSLVIVPKKILSPATQYFVLIKGDENLSSDLGVLSAEKIGMNERGFIPVSENSNPVKFNGRSYRNAYSFSFTTLPENGARNGICEIDYVKISPSSYLFQKTADDANEDDSNPEAKSFDAVRDGDKLFSADAYSSSNQLLNPVSGYNWNWSWKVTNKNVADFSSEPVGLPGNRRLVVANSTVTDGQTQITATIDMSAYRSGCGANCNKFFIGDSVYKSSDVYVFSCANPWPAVRPDGTWYPWQDSSGNCSGSGACDNFNYKFYYCRDAGQPGTFDDLPVINYSPVSLTGNLVCSSDKTPCSAPGSACSGGGVCIWEILKESYFFRDAILSGVEITSLTDTKKGGEAEVKWQSTAEGVGSYKIYYLKSGGGEMLSKEVKPIGPGGVCGSDSSGRNFICSTKIAGLIDDQAYVFKISVLSSSRTESAFSNEKTIKTSDTIAPAAPTGIIVSTSTTAIKFSWNKNSEDGVFYRLYFGINPGQYAESVDTNPNVNEITLLKSKLSGNSYYIAVSAIDKNKNEGAKSKEIHLISANGNIWVKALESLEILNGDACVVRLNYVPTNSANPICYGSLKENNQGWFQGKIRKTANQSSCFIDYCQRDFELTTCTGAYGLLNGNCYISARSIK